MTKYKINLCSKNKKSLDYFLNFSKCNVKLQNFQSFSNLLKRKKTIKKITVLKSPHVNKTAQEQFGYTIYSLKMICNSWDAKKYLVILKKIKNYLFPGIKIQVDALFTKKKIYLKTLFCNPMVIIFFYPLRIYLKQKIKSKFSNLRTVSEIKNLSKKSLFYLNILSLYGQNELGNLK